MKTFKNLLIMLILGTTIATFAGCGANSTEETTQSQTVTVTRGDLSLEITAAGNLELAKTQDLAVELSPLYSSGSKATVGEVLVAVGDSVQEGQTLVIMDKSEWADQLDSLGNALTTAQRNVTAKQRALTTAQRAVTTKETAVITAQRLVTTKELAVIDAQLDVTSANITLNNINEIKTVQDEIDMLNSVIEYAELELGNWMITQQLQYWQSMLVSAKARLVEAEAELADLLNGTSTLTTEEVALQVAEAQLGIQKAQAGLEDAQIAVENAQQAVIDAQLNLADAQLDVEDAQTDLDDANQTLADAQETLDNAGTVSAEIAAPFEGFITSVNVAGGDQILNGTVVVQIADPSMFEVEILVSEMDILNVAISANGTMTADAIPDVNFPVTVTWISPTATISSSVVNYPVTVEVTSLIGVSTTETSSLPSFSGNFTPPEGFTPSDNFTPSANFTPGQGFPGSDNSTPNMMQMAPTNAAQVDKEYTLKSGMTVTVTLNIPLSTNALLVPSSVIMTLNGMSFVEVMTSDNTTEQRMIITGNTDYTNTEIVSGLSEGDKIVITSSASITTITSEPSFNRPNEVMMPNFGGQF